MHFNCIVAPLLIMISLFSAVAIFTVSDFIAMLSRPPVVQSHSSHVLPLALLIKVAFDLTIGVYCDRNNERQFDPPHHLKGTDPFF